MDDDLPRFDAARWDDPAPASRWVVSTLPALSRLVRDCQIRAELIEADLLRPIDPPAPPMSGGLSAGYTQGDT